MKRILLSAFAILSIAGPAMAGPITLPAANPTFFQFNNLEQVNPNNLLTVPGYAPAAGMLQGNWGVVNVSSIQNGAVTLPGIDINGGPAFFSDDGPGGTQGQVTGIFYGIQIDTATTAHSGFLDLYWHDAGADTVTAACLAGGAPCVPATAAATFGTGTFLARLDFASGILGPGDCATTISSSTNPATLGGSGHADSFANVDTSVVGAWTNILNGNWFTTPCGIRDVRFSNFFNADVASWGTGAGGTVGLRSNDPARVLTVPEPTSLTLLGFGLAGLARMRRRFIS